MFIFAHLVAGLIVGRISGNYPVSLVGAIFADLDHLIPYVQHKVIFNIKKFWKTITGEQDNIGNQRNYLHNIIVFATLSFLVFIFDFRIGLIFSIAYLSHLLLDLIDTSDFYPFYPSKMNIKGPIGYFSRAEIYVTLGLFIIFLLI
ncbi:MAG TPA: metal-dependent hydrolase [Candidatus Nanoarchaeia archaeon]|nr:metal-dependent hydrolase [Candidatus Nanoarchaeia archaeon]